MELAASAGSLIGPALCAFRYLRSQFKFAEYGIALGLRRYKPFQHHEELDARARRLRSQALRDGGGSEAAPRAVEEGLFRLRVRAWAPTSNVTGRP